MFALQITETAGLLQCHTCDAELLERDRFCRRCGVCQRPLTAPLVVMTGGTDRLKYETRPLPGGANPIGSFSGTLVNFVTQSVAEKTSSLRADRWMRRLVGALVIVPLWMMIALLSPLDAYAAAKAIVRPN